MDPVVGVAVGGWLDPEVAVAVGGCGVAVDVFVGLDARAVLVGLLTVPNIPPPVRLGV